MVGCETFLNPSREFLCPDDNTRRWKIKMDAARLLVKIKVVLEEIDVVINDLSFTMRLVENA